MAAAVVIVAAGRGSRAAAGGNSLPKQYWALAGQSVIARTTSAFVNHPDISQVMVVIHPDDDATAAAALGPAMAQRVSFVHGGRTRQLSVAAGLLALADKQPRAVLIHDAARPFVSSGLISRLVKALNDHDAVLPALAVADTLKRAHQGLVTQTVDRSDLYAAQTPQAFAYKTIRDAHAKAMAAGRDDFTDDVAIVEWCGGSVRIVEGEAGNTKLTTAQDFATAEAGLRQRSAVAMETRTGFGFDVHEFGSGNAVVLCGVSIPHERALSGHSDADVGLHALTDALLGALCEGDIGVHFPPSDPQWKGASSDRFLEHAAGLARARGGKILHADVTFLCEAPKIGPHRDAMRDRMAAILRMDRSRIGVKATTMEGLGFIGRREGIAAQATATVLLPVSDNAV